jgi:hypothetical protein
VLFYNSRGLIGNPGVLERLIGTKGVGPGVLARLIMDEQEQEHEKMRHIVSSTEQFRLKICHELHSS